MAMLVGICHAVAVGVMRAQRCSLVRRTGLLRRCAPRNDAMRELFHVKRSSDRLRVFRRASRRR